MRPEDATAARLLRDARWMTGLTQAEMAQRAGVTRQVVTRYESGGRSPSVGTLDRLLAGCGVRLRLSMVPEPGLEDVPTRELLALPMLERLDIALQDVLIDLAESVRDRHAMLVSGKAAARLHGAVVRAEELEVWFRPDQPIDTVRCWLADAGIAEPFPLTSAVLREGITLTHGLDETEVIMRCEPHFAGFLHRSSQLDLGRGVLASLVEPDDCVYGWHPRDRDHLAVQRAVRLVGEQTM